MKISQLCNASLVIQANVNKIGDMDKASLVAAQMELDSEGDIVVTSECEYEKWVQVCACWENFQAKELKDAYFEAKRIVG